MTESLYLIIEQSRRRWRGVRIARVSKKRPHLSRPSEQALVRLRVVLPDGILNPREISVEIKPEHLASQPVTVTPEKPIL